ncbi:MAG: MATE family efflux transporter [Candidatus Choladocola sp.]|nr:MATE family efflux transporter [Candidatus Choladocola sp.]
MTKDMTEGKPLRLILQFALPLLIGNLLQQTYNMIDAAIVGKCLGTEALAGVGASSSVQFLVLGFCTGVCSGFGVPVAKYFGAGEYDRMRSCIFHAGFLTVVTAAFLTTVCAVLCPGILHLLSTPDDIYRNAYAYLLVIFLGIPFTLLYNLLAGILRAVGDSRTPFLFLAFSTCLNVALDLFCILVLRWGCAGAAIATVTAQAVSGICCFIFIRKKYELIRLKKRDCKVKKNVTGEMLMMGLPMGLQFSITAIGSMVMQSANNSLGSVYVSGFTAGMRIKQFVMCPFDAIGNGVSVFCGQNLGAGKADRIRHGLKDGLTIAVLYGFCAGLVLIFAGYHLSMLFVNSEATDVLNASAKYLRCMGYFFWSLGFLNICRMCTQGLGYPGRAIFSGVTEMIARTVVSFAFVGYFGYTAICFADQTAWVSACFYIVPVCFLSVKSAQKRIMRTE